MIKMKKLLKEQPSLRTEYFVSGYFEEENEEGETNTKLEYDVVQASDAKTAINNFRSRKQIPTMASAELVAINLTTKEITEE